MAPKVTAVFTATGLESVQFSADTHEEQQIANELGERIQICLDIADAILKKHSAGPRG
jgi:hypothetical protein